MERKRLIPLVAAALLATGCPSTITGNEGNLVFSYFSDDRVEDFNKPIAIGAKLDLSVTEAGSGQSVELQSATTDDPAVLTAELDPSSANKLVLTGTGSGGTLVKVTAKTSGGLVKPDSVYMSARKPDVLKLMHNCTPDRDAQYLVNQDVLVSYEMQMSNGQPVIGYFPEHAEPFDVSPLGGVTVISSKDQANFHLTTGAIKGAVSLISKVDSTLAKLLLVEEKDIDAAEFTASPTPLSVGQTGYYHLTPKSAGKPICQAHTALTATSTATSICEVSASSSQTSGGDAYGFVKVTGKAAGTCTFNAVYPKGNGGAGLTVPLSVTVQ